MVPALEEPLWLDEVVSARVIVQPKIGGALQQVRKTESSPPGWHLLNWAVWRASGRPSLEWLRMLSVVFGGAMAGLVVVYALALGLPVPAASIAGMAAALGPNLVAHGSELRPYAALTLLALLFAIALDGAARRPFRTQLVLLTFVVGLGCLTHYFFLFTLGVGFVWALLRTATPIRTRLAVAMIIGALPLLTWLPSFVSQYRHNLYAYIGPFNARAVVYSFARIIGVLGESGGGAAVVRLLFVLLVLAGAAELARTRRGELAALLAVAPIVGAAIAWLLGPHVFNERNLLVVAPFVSVAIGAAIARMPVRGRVPLAAAVAAALALSLWHFEVEYGRSSYDAIAQTLLEQGWRQDDVIAQFGPAPLGLSMPVGWYLPGHPILVRARRSRCGRLYAISYDAGPGFRWIQHHAATPRSVRIFPAYDHTPRGPQASTPIAVSAIGGGGGAASAAIADGARLIHAAGHAVVCR